MKILLICPKIFALHLPLSSGFIQLGHNVEIVDPNQLFNPNTYKINSQAYRLPNRIRRQWNRYFFDKIEKNIKEKYLNIRPDFVIIYNHGWLKPETVRFFRKHSKVFFYIVDSPFNSLKDNYYLYNLLEADHVFSMDTSWIQQLEIIGLKRISFLLAGVDDETFFTQTQADDFYQDYSSDLVFIGNCHSTIEGYKRSLFLSQFAGMDLKIHGNIGWKKWFKYFPELNKHFILKKSSYSYSKINGIYNCCLIAPIETYPGVISGPHPKLFDCIASGIFPLAEYRRDTERIFKDTGIALVKDYTKARDMAEYFLKMKTERDEIINKLRELVLNNYTSKNFAQGVLANFN